MPSYRLIQVDDAINGRHWEVQKREFGLYWSSYFDVHWESGASFRDYAVAKKWYDSYLTKRQHFKVLEECKINYKRK